MTFVLLRCRVQIYHWVCCRVCVGRTDTCSSGQGRGRSRAKELSEREAGCVYARDRTGAPLLICQSECVLLLGGTLYIVQLLSSVRLQFLSRSFLNLMCTGMFLLYGCSWWWWSGRKRQWDIMIFLYYTWPNLSSVVFVSLGKVIRFLTVWGKEMWQLYNRVCHHIK